MTRKDEACEGNFVGVLIFAVVDFTFRPIAGLVSDSDGDGVPDSCDVCSEDTRPVEESVPSVWRR
jgi:hypothetical protein